MPQPAPPPSPVDRVALEHVLARLARAPTAPWLHQEVARRMAERLPLIRQAPLQWLDWWGHLGGGAASVAAVWPKATRWVVEPTDALVSASRLSMRGPWWSVWQRSTRARRVMHQDDVGSGQAQMIWANLMLHASVDPVATMAQWFAALPVAGFIMFSTFGPDSLRELREVFAEQGWPSPHPPFVDMHNIGDQLVGTGFTDPVMDQQRLSLSWSSASALIDELRTLGGHLGRARFQGLRTPRWREQLRRALERRADAQGRIHLSFELVFGHAFKAQPKPGRAEVTTVSLESLRSNLRDSRTARSAALTTAQATAPTKGVGG